MNKIIKLREKIDTTDKKIIDNLAERMELVSKVGKFKRARGITPLDEKRWQRVTDDRSTLAEDLGLPVDMVVDIFNVIHKHSLKVQVEMDS